MLRFSERKQDIDEGLMIGWFASAIETGRSAGAARREPGPGDETEFQRGVRTLADLIRCHYPSFNEHKIHEMFDVLIPPTGVAGPGDRAMAGARECCSKYSTKQGHDYTCDLPHGHTGIHMARKYGGYIAESWTDTEAAAIERSQTPQGVPK
jgi:hypothetical protein